VIRPSRAFSRVNSETEKFSETLDLVWIDAVGGPKRFTVPHVGDKFFTASFQLVKIISIDSFEHNDGRIKCEVANKEWGNPRRKFLFAS
jgi:hypothetical protein